MDIADNPNFARGITMATSLPVLIEPEQLARHLDDKLVLIVDMRSPDAYTKGHIPGAVNLAYVNIIRPLPPAMGMAPDSAQLSAVLSSIGLTSESHIVAYDDEGGGRAGRLLWTLDALGHQGLSLLNGGLHGWVAQGRALEQQSNRPELSGYKADFVNPDVMADKDYIVQQLGRADFLPVDARSPQEYSGEDVRAARGGHIPGAANFNWVEAIDRDNELRFFDDATLERLLQTRGITRDKEIVLYCQTHHRSSHTYMVLKHLGYPRIRGYAGAWSEWGNDPNLPIE